MAHEDIYAGLFQRKAISLGDIESRIEHLIDKRPVGWKGHIVKLNAVRDALIAKAAARKGAALAAGSIPGVAGGLAASGIRGMDVVEHEFTPEVMRNYNLEGAAQGLRQFSVAPPGSGRLVPISFYLTGGSTTPIITLPSVAGGLGAFSALVTTPVNWAVLRLVALTTQQYPAVANAIGVMQDFKIGGSPNLFLYETNVLMDDYDTDKEQYAGLRAYPVLISPNVSEVDVATFAPVLSAAANYVALSLVTEVLRDDAFGPGLPGAYAR